jgi:hypothetical protein
MTSNTPRNRARRAVRYFERLATAERERATGARAAGDEVAAKRYEQKAAELDARVAKTTSLPEWVKVGVKFKMNFGPDNPNNSRTYEIRAIVDDRAVIREWWNTKQRWNYTVEDDVSLRVMSEYVVFYK